MVLSQSDVVDQTRQMLRWRSGEQSRLQRIHDYLRNKQRFTWLPDGVPAEVRRLAEVDGEVRQVVVVIRDPLVVALRHLLAADQQ